jgi:hypothetical protein
MKRLIILVTFAVALFAASLNGIRGSITVQATGDNQTTVVGVSSIDPDVSQFRVTVTYTATITGLPGWATVTVPADRGRRVAVDALRVTETQHFGN